MAFVFTVGLFAIVFPDSSVGRFVAGMFVGRGKPLSLAKIAGMIVMCLALAAFASAFPMELALLAAGDIAAYTELMVAIGIVVSQVRLRQLCEGVVRIFRPVVAKVAGYLRTGRRAVRVARTQRPPCRGKDSESSDADGAGFVFV
jgi:hypothetical protein